MRRFMVRLERAKTQDLGNRAKNDPDLGLMTTQRQQVGGAGLCTGGLGARAFHRKREEYDPESGMRAASGRIAQARVGTVDVP